MIPSNRTTSDILSLNIPLKNNVLLVSGNTVGDDVLTTQIALAPTEDLTGISSVIVQPDFLRRESLARFRSIYMINVPEIPPDALPQLESFVRGGGGLVWFLGENIKVDHYNKVLAKMELNKENQLVRLEDSLFPVMLGNTHVELERDETVTAPDLSFASHPIFNNTFKKDNPLIAGVTVTGYMPVVKEWIKDDAQRKDGVTTVGYTRDGAPIAFDHRFGKGRVMTFLTSAGAPWNNLEKTPVFALLIQEMQKYVARPDEEKRARQIGEPIELELPALDYDPEMEWILPGTQGTRPHTMERREGEPQSAADGAGQKTTETPTEAAPQDGEAPDAALSEEKPTNTAYLYGRYNDTDFAGIYGYKVRPLIEGLPDKGEFAYNVAPEEGSMKLATDEEIRKHLEPEARVAIREYGDTSYIDEGVDPGQEVRNYLMYLLLFLLIAEQAMAYRLSYHPETAEAPA